MSKIAVLTLPFNNNYGGLLQSYALQEFLRRRGHDVMVIKMSIIIPDRSMKGVLKNFIKVIIGKKIRDKRILEKVSKNMVQFMNNNMNCTLEINDKKDFLLLNDYNYDTYVVGSDQVWRFDYTKDRFLNYFFDFVKNDKIKRISFAASFGIDKWAKNEKETLIISSLLKKFQAISVREKSGVELCKNNLGITPTHLLDPVFLLNMKDYQELINTKTKQNNSDDDGDLLVYMLDYTEDKHKAVEIISKATNYSPFRVGINPKNKNIIYPPVSEWIDGFMKAKYIITDSFHGCVFAILFHKPFIVYGNNSRGLTRFDSLLETFNLKSRFITNSLELKIEMIKEDINFNEINEIIIKKRNEADLFLAGVEL